MDPLPHSTVVNEKAKNSNQRTKKEKTRHFRSVESETKNLLSTEKKKRKEENNQPLEKFESGIW